MNSGIVVWPLDTHLAALTVAYSIIKCASLFAALCWHGSILTEGQISAEPKYAAIDWQCWVRYGSWSQCPHCGSLMYNDQYFRDNIYQTRATTGKPCPMSVHGGASPSEPLVHAHGHVGVSSRWWYLSPMYKPVAACGACTPPPEEQSPRLLRVRYGSKAAPRRVPQTQVASYVRPPLQRTGQLYRVARMRPSSELSSEGREPWARECVTWPRYRDSEFVLGDGLGESMLELTTEEQRALQVVSLRCEVRKETYGRADHFNWKKVGLSRAYSRNERVCEESMPTDRSKAALRFLLANNAFYKVPDHHHHHHHIL